MSTDLAEVWAPVPGYEGWYDVSADGQVMRVRNVHGATPGKILKHSVTRAGYHQVRLYDGRGFPSSKAHYVHRLVAAAFLGPIPANHQANHIDGDKSNNAVDNLEIVTAKQNIHHAERMALRPKAKGEKHGRAKITERDVINIRMRRAAGMPLAVLAAAYGLSVGAVSRVARRLSWRHI